MSIFEDILKEAETRQADRRAKTDVANQRKADELAEMVDHVEGRKFKRKRINWEDHRRYLHEAYQAGVERIEMARVITDRHGQDVSIEDVSKALSVLGISAGQGSRNGMSPVNASKESADPDMWEMVG